MTRISSAAWFVLAIIVLLLPAAATPPSAVSFACISGSCGGIGSSLESNSGTLPPGTLVSVGGFFAVGDGGGGNFVVLGQQSTTLCNTYVGSNASGTVGQSSIGFSAPFASGLVVGEGVSGGSPDGTIQIAPGSEIASITINQQGQQTAITLTLPMTGTASGTQTDINVSVAGSNGGTLLLDGTTGGPNCYQKTNYRGDPHEWGALGDGMTDDTPAIENWLGAYGNVNPNFNPAMTPPNFGPWVASIPATYVVSQPLSCPPNATIQGNENLTNNGITGNPNPRVNFQAATGFSGLSYQSASGSTYYGSQAVFGALNFCRLSGIAVSGNNFSLATTGDITAQPTVISNVGNVTGVQPGNAVYVTDVLGNVLTTDGTVVVAVDTSCTGAPCVTVSQALSATVLPVFVFFFGPDAVDVLGQNVTIDGFSLLQNGRYDLFCGTGATGLQVQYTHLQTAMQHGIYIPGSCSNVRLVGNNVSQAGSAAAALGNGTPVIGGDGIYFGGTEGSIEGGVIQGSAGAGLRLLGASRMSVTGMDIEGNGTQSVGGDASAGIAIDQAHSITICNNHMEGNGGDDSDSAQIYFGHVAHKSNNNVTLCSNVYETETAGKKSATVDVAPMYVYDAAAQAPLTNIHIYETAAQPAVSVFSQNAQPLLQSATVPQFTQNQISGLTLSNDSNPQYIDVAAGSAADSSNSTIITLPQISTSSPLACTINLGIDGPGGLDTDSVKPERTYFVFAIAPAGGQGSPSCMASLSPTPTFENGAFNNTGYQQSATGGTQSGSIVLYNVNPLAGVMVGDEVVASGSLPSGARVAAFSANTPATTTASANFSKGDTTISVAGTSGIELNMAMADANSNSCVWTGVTVATISTDPDEITISPGAPCGGSSNDPLVFSGASQLNLTSSATAQSIPTLTIGTGYYRLLGVLYTDDNSNVVLFKQDGDTFYLMTSVEDITPSVCPALESLSTTCALSVPCGRNAACKTGQGVHVEAFGRILGGGSASQQLLLSSIDQADQMPTAFSASAPGYTTTEATGTTAFPFRIYTDLNGTTGTSTGSVRIRVNDGAGVPVYEVTDGWIFHR
ncbi:MAG TPA: right-handed parallel beta-helix repeat-containing protein [Rhizomicrobium sp.]|nr:right-handed parallel beta-helix repeat-containing protein [Rhizomicrobium sp.]